jgi:formate dehydrogenase subunit delta
MNIDLLVKMANEIGAFFAGTTDTQAASAEVARHLNRYWEPRMRAQMLSYFEQRQGAGLTEIARGGVALMYAASKASPAASAPAAGAKG